MRILPDISLLSPERQSARMSQNLQMTA